MNFTFPVFTLIHINILKRVNGRALILVFIVSNNSEVQRRISLLAQSKGCKWGHSVVPLCSSLPSFLPSSPPLHSLIPSIPLPSSPSLSPFLCSVLCSLEEVTFSSTEASFVSFDSYLVSLKNYANLLAWKKTTILLLFLLFLGSETQTGHRQMAHLLFTSWWQKVEYPGCHLYLHIKHSS